jgi:hypothetical protein
MLKYVLSIVLLFLTASVATAAPCAGPAPSGGNDTTAINNAIAACSGPVVLQAGTYNVSGTINLRAINNAGLIGLGQNTTWIKSSSTTGTVVQGAASVSGQTISGLNISRTSNGNGASIGLDVGASQTGAHIEDIYSGGDGGSLHGHGTGCVFRAADTTSTITFVKCEHNVGDGTWFVSPGTTMGWTTALLINELNGSTGFVFNGAYGGGSSAALSGTLKSMATYGNGGDGATFSNISSGSPIGWFLGNDAGSVEFDVVNSTLSPKSIAIEYGGVYNFYQYGTGTVSCYNCVSTDARRGQDFFIASSSGSWYQYGGGAWIFPGYTDSFYVYSGSFYAYASRAKASASLNGTGVGLVVSSYWGSFSCSMSGGCNFWGLF